VIRSGRAHTPQNNASSVSFSLIFYSVSAFVSVALLVPAANAIWYRQTSQLLWLRVLSTQRTVRDSSLIDVEKKRVKKAALQYRVTAPHKTEKVFAWIPLHLLDGVTPPHRRA
jgi:hypothetical protein